MGTISIEVLLIIYLVCVLSGVLLGMIPFFVGLSKGKAKLGGMGWLFTGLASLVGGQIPVFIVFLVLVCKDSGTEPVQSVPVPAPQPEPVSRSASMALSCLSGQLKGNTYQLGEGGVVLGRDYDCSVCFAPETPGISRHHCQLYFDQGALMLMDLNSAYGTFTADGKRLQPQTPVPMYVGGRFYLADSSNMFQIILTV